MPSYPIRVLVVDDSAYLRKVVSEMLMRSPRIEVVGTARDGLDALEKIDYLQPDVVTVDLFMPELDGVEFLRAQMARQPLPIVICSIASESGEKAVAAMESGAVEFIRKPTALSTDRLYEMSDDLIEKVLTAASASIDKLDLQPFATAPTSTLEFRPSRGTVEVVVIGVSTGGPQALRTLLPRIPANFPVPIAIVLHIPSGYTGPLAERLDKNSSIEVLEASEGLELRAGRAILAQAGYHLTFKNRPDGQVVAHLGLSPENLSHRPAVDVLFESAAEVFGPRTLAVVLTGMGDDGTRGAAAIKEQGGLVFTEAESSCVVYGMPRSVVEAGFSDKIIPLDELIEIILETI